MTEFIVTCIVYGIPIIAALVFGYVFRVKLPKCGICGRCEECKKPLEKFNETRHP